MGNSLCHKHLDQLTIFRTSPRHVATRLAAEPGKNEQMVVNDLLAQEDPDLAWSTLPPGFYARTHGWPPPRDLSIYHANYTAGAGGLERKLKQFREVRFLRKYGPFSWLISVVKFGVLKIIRYLLKRS
jgi:hypothetical protein